MDNGPCPGYPSPVSHDHTTPGFSLGLSPMLFKSVEKVGEKVKEGSHRLPCRPRYPENCLSALAVSSGSSVSPFSQVPNFFPRIQASAPAGIAGATPPHLLRRFPLEQQVSRVNIAGERNVKTQAQDPFLRGSLFRWSRATPLRTRT